MPRALAYVRVSSDGQADNTSLDVQADRVAAYATARGWTLDGMYSDVASGATLDRPGLSALRDALRPGDAVIVYKLDRLSRSIVDAEPLISEWESRGVALHSVSEPLDTSSAMGRAMLRMVLVFAQAEREVIAERVASGKRRRAKEGGFNGGRVPYGYRAGAESGSPFVVHVEEAAKVREAFRVYSRGRIGAGRLAAKVRLGLSEAGVSEMLANPVYTGRLRWSEVARPGEHEAIVSDRLFLSVQRARRARTRAARFRAWERGGTMGELVLSCGAR